MVRINKGYIYLITCIINGKHYVGQTRKYRYNNTIRLGIRGRYNQHIYNAINHRDDCPKLNRAIRKYGAENFMVDKLKSCSLDELNYYEKYYIQVFNSAIEGYNCTLGGDSYKLSEEQLNKMNKSISEKAKLRWSDPAFKKKMSKKISLTNKKKMWEKDTRKKMLDALKDKRKAPHLPSNIYQRKIKGQLVGYEVKIKFNGTLIRRCFSSKKYSPKENLNKAKKCLKEIIESLEVISV